MFCLTLKAMLFFFFIALNCHESYFLRLCVLHDKKKKYYGILCKDFLPKNLVPLISHGN